MKVLLIVAHPRPGSLTHQVAEAFARAAGEQGHTIELADLVAEKFDPVLREPDEPDWTNATKIYSGAVRAEMARIKRNDATVMIFPVWWWSMPAVLKGWIDRVWNQGFAYGGHDYPHERVLMIAIAGTSKESYERRGYDKAMHTQLATGVLDYCGVKNGSLEVLYGSIESDGEPAKIMQAAGKLGASF